jgi:transposase
MTVIMVSRNELTRLRVLIDISDGRLSVEDATGLIGVGRRQIYRLLDAFRARGPEGLISRKRGRPSNRARGAVFRETVLAIVRERYADFGPTLAAEKLSEVHGLDLGVETLRQWMIAAGLWRDPSSASRFTSRGRGASALANWSRSTAASIGGLRIAGRNAPCWCLSTMPPAD